MKLNFRLVALILVSFLTLGILAACSGSNSAGGESDNDASASNSSEAKNAASTEKNTESGKAFYDGKTITLIVATKAGGGYDTYARMLAPRLEKQLPGSKVIVKNVPGAGHIIGTNEIYHSKPDGLTFGTFNKGLITAQVTEMQGIKFNLKDMSWLGTPATEPRLWVTSKQSPFKTVEDVLSGEHEFIFSSAGVGSSSHTDAMIMEEILDIPKMKIITGYSGTEGELAMMRGEVHGQIASIDSVKSIIESGDARPILVIGTERLEDYPDVPTLAEIRPDKTAALADLMISQALISRPYAGPPGIPEERLAVLRDAFAKAWADPDLLEEAKRIGRPISFMDGEKTEKLIKNAVNQPPEVVELLKEIIVEE